MNSSPTWTVGPPPGASTGSSTGFTRGGKLAKIGLDAQDTAELFFDDVLVPHQPPRQGRTRPVLLDAQPDDRADERGRHRHGIHGTHLSPHAGVHPAATSLGRAVADFQHNRFVLAELATQIQVARVFVDRCVTELVAGTLTPEAAARAKLSTTELQQTVVQRCLQLYGGYGYMREYPIARDFLDARVTTLFAGTGEIMKEIIARSLP